MNAPQPAPATPAVKLNTGLSVASFVLGLLAIGACLLFLTGIPAIITGHIARSRAKRQPGVYGGGGLALAGLILGYLSIPLTILCAVIAAVVIPHIASQQRGGGGGGGWGGGNPSTRCQNNLKSISLAARIWSNEHSLIYPPDYASMSNELVTTSLLICPGDEGKTPAADFTQIDPTKNVSYEYLTPGAKEADVAAQTTFRCPVHGHVALGDGSVQGK